MKRIAKHILLAIAIVLTAPFWITVYLFSSFGKDKPIFVSLSQLLGLLPGLTGVFCRRAFYFMTLESCERDCFIDFGTWFSNRNVRVDSQVYVGCHCIIGTSSIGRNVLIGSNVHVLSGRYQHRFIDPDRPINEQGGHYTKVIIGEDCWIGNCSVIIANIERGSVIGAGSVVVNDIPALSIAAGNPARVIRSR